MVDFNALKNRNSKAAIQDLKEKVAAQSGNNNKYEGANDNTDIRFWQPAVDSVGNGYAIIRFLSEAPEDDLKYVQTFEHGFQGPSGKWYIEKSRTTIKEKDPVTEYTNKLWATKDESQIELAKKYKRRLYYIANIYVVSDPSRPENEGKVFLFKFGKKIMDKLEECMTPEFDSKGRTKEHPDYDVSEIQFDPFSMWEGANIQLKVRKYEGQRNFDKSVVEPRSLLLKTDAQREAVWKKQFSLKEFITDGPRFKSYEVLKARLQEVLGDAEDDWGPAVVKDKPKSPTQSLRRQTPIEDDDIPFKKGDGPSNRDDGDSDIDFFKSLAE